MAVEEGFTNVCCESYAWNVIQSLTHQNTALVHWSSKGIIRKILELCPKFHSISFSWTPREANHLAHLVAHWSATNVNYSYVFPLLNSQIFVDSVNHDCGSLTTI